MNKISKIVFLAFFLGALGLVNAQNENEGYGSEALKFEERNIQLNVLSNESASLHAINSSTDQNNIFIAQIGNNNNIESTVSSQSQDVNLSQFGDRNNMFLNVQATTLRETIVQNGNDNTVTDVNYYRINNRNVEVIQNGNRQNLTFFGGNTISESLKVSMQGQGQSIIVRSF